MPEQTIGSTEPAAFVGIDWADQKHDIHLQPADGSPATGRQIESLVERIQEWKLMEHGFFVLYPINPSALSSFREAFLQWSQDRLQ